MFIGLFVSVLLPATWNSLSLSAKNSHWQWLARLKIFSLFTLAFNWHWH